MPDKDGCLWNNACMILISSNCPHAGSDFVPFVANKKIITLKFQNAYIPPTTNMMYL